MRLGNIYRVTKHRILNNFGFNYKDFYISKLGNTELFQNLDVVMVNCVDPLNGIKQLEFYQSTLNPKNIILFSHENIISKQVKTIKIRKINSWRNYNDFLLKLPIISDYILIVQTDGIILNPSLFTAEFYNYDYVGAPWPGQKEWIDLQLANHKYLSKLDLTVFNRIGNGGFSLRSQKHVEFAKKYSSCHGVGEDLFLNVCNFKNALTFGLKYPSVNVALKFAIENPLLEMSENWELSYNIDPTKHFGMHGKQFINSEKIINDFSY